VFVELPRLEIDTITINLIVPDDAQGCDGDVILLLTGFGKIGCAIGEDGDVVGHNGVIVLYNTFRQMFDLSMGCCPFRWLFPPKV
jgi:hypothetical protein